MKYSELNERERKAKLHVIDQDWEIHSKWRAESLDIITKHLFTLNSGGLLASLAYLAAKEEANGVNTLIWLFFAGTACVVLRATIDYYMSESRLALLRKDIGRFYDYEIDFEEYVKRLNKRAGSSDILLHLLGWSSAILFTIAISIGVSTIQPEADPVGSINFESLRSSS